MLKYNKQFDKFLKENPEIEYDVKLTNISLPNIASDDDYDFICVFCGKGFFQSLDNKEFKTHKCNACPYCPEIFIMDWGFYFSKYSVSKGIYTFEMQSE